MTLMRSRKRSLERNTGSHTYTYTLNGRHYASVPFSKSTRDAARRRKRLALAFIIAFPCFLFYFIWFQWRLLWVICAKFRYGFGVDVPPSFEEFYARERGMGMGMGMGQHNASLGFPEGRYLWVSNPHWGLGWNNVFQVIYMTSHLAYLSDRAYVFGPYMWTWGPPRPFTEYNGHLTSSRIPLSAFIDGPIVGGPFPPNKPNPRSVTIDYFDKVCPESRRKKISIREMNQGLEGKPVIEILEKYTKALKALNESCVELFGGNDHVFDWPQFGHPSMETVYPSLSQSPILTEFSWAPHILEAVRKNTQSFVPELTTPVLPELVPDLMAIHIRRGDYIQHCYHLANWSAEYMGWAQSPGLPDRFKVPSGGGAGYNTPENTRVYLERCFPDVEEIVGRVGVVRKEWEDSVFSSSPSSASSASSASSSGNADNKDGVGDEDGGKKKLRRLFIMTNGERGWVASLKQRLYQEGGWDSILSSRDLVLSPEQKAVAQTVDMAIAQRAAVFLGNGFSSLTGNEILLRRVHGHPIFSNRFW